ncbi:MauE/DoxX family redox-associated membrane protein [Streptomyces klenkii]|uniref:MauE/DoxX family redox-associated membrane protein n=1 Tax=Streptomyces klenkii TaxID=1420899 RepID=UPI0036E7CC9E
MGSRSRPVSMVVVMEWIVAGARAAIGVVFVSAALSKLGRRRWTEFRAAVTALVPAARGSRSTALAGMAVIADWTVVLLLALPGRAGVVAGLGLAASALAVYTLVLAAAVRRGTGAPCRCFGASTRPVSGVQLIRNAALLVVTVAGLAAAGLSGDSGSEAVPDAALWVAAGAGGLLGAVLTVFEDLADLFTEPVRPGASTAGPPLTTRRPPATTQEHHTTTQEHQR